METILILLVIASIIPAIGWYGFRKMCPICHRWNGLKKIYSEHERTETRHRTETRKETLTDRQGRVKGYKDYKVDVPYNVVYNKVTFKCSNKNCNERVQLTMRNGKYEKEAGFVFILTLILIFSAFSPNKEKSVKDNNNVISNQYNTVDTLSNYSKTNVSKVNDYSSKKSSNGDAKPENSNLSSKASSNGDAEFENSASQPKELVIESPTEKPNNAQVSSKQTVITAESPEYLKRELAFEMLKRRKDVEEIADSTYLSKSQIRKLRRNIEK